MLRLKYLNYHEIFINPVCLNIAKAITRYGCTEVAW